MTSIRFMLQVLFAFIALTVAFCYERMFQWYVGFSLVLLAIPAAPAEIAGTALLVLLGVFNLVTALACIVVSDWHPNDLDLYWCRSIWNDTVGTAQKRARS